MRLYLALGLIALTLAFFGYQIWQSYRLATDLWEVAGELEQLGESELSDIDLAEAAELLRRARTDASGLQARMRFVAPVTNRLGWLPRVGQTLSAAGPLLDYVSGLLTAADEVGRGLAPLMEGGEKAAEDPRTLSERLLEALVAARPNLIEADAALVAASVARSQFNLEQLPHSLRSPVAKSDRLFPPTHAAVGALQVLPAVLGEDGPRAYLLLAQNRDERRATGGFISGVGNLVIEKGRVVSLQLEDSYSVDDLSKAYPPPPEPLRRYMQAGIWLVRDANWSPDFPTAAWYARQLYQLSTDQTVDGVVAFDQSAIARVLTATGPVLLPSVPEPIGAANLEAYMHEVWAPQPGGELSQEWWENRKAFMGELGEAIVDQVQRAGDRQMFLELARAAVDMIEEKHLLIQIEDPVVAAAMAELGWDGALTPGAGDFLMLVDSNVGFNKVDPKVERSLAYAVDLSDPWKPSASVRIRYLHSVVEEAPCVHRASYGEGTYADLQARCYWDYVRVLTPNGSQLIGGSLPPTPGVWLLSGAAEPGLWDVAEAEGGTTAFGGIFVLPTGAQAELDLAYTLPASVVSKGPDGSIDYALRLTKQPGSEGISVTVQIVPPQGFTARNPQGWEVLVDGSLLWEGRLIKDVELKLKFLLDSS